MSQFHKKLFSQLAGNQPAHSPNIVPGALGPLALSRHGLSQDELLALMAQSVPAATAEALLGLKRELGEAVVETDGVWKFAHADGVIREHGVAVEGEDGGAEGDAVQPGQQVLGDRCREVAQQDVERQRGHHGPRVTLSPGRGTGRRDGSGVYPEVPGRREG